jgi:hypothetical protein
MHANLFITVISTYIRALTFPFCIHTHNKLIYEPCVCLCVYTFLGELIKMSVEALVKEAFADWCCTAERQRLLHWIETLEQDIS